jgi:hypothetical protein
MAYFLVRKLDIASYGFRVVSQKGSHIKMKKITPNFGFRGILISKSPIELYAIYN